MGAGERRVTESDISNRSKGQGVGQATCEKSSLASGMVSAKALGQVQARLPFLQDLKGPSVICSPGRETEAQRHGHLYKVTAPNLKLGPGRSQGPA